MVTAGVVGMVPWTCSGREAMPCIPLSWTLSGRGGVSSLPAAPSAPAAASAGNGEPQEGTPPPSPLHPQPCSVNPKPNPTKTRQGASLVTATEPHGTQHGWEQGASGGKRREGGRPLPSPAGVPGRPCCVGIIVSSGEAGKPKAGPAEKPPGWFSGVGAARLTSAAATSRLGPAPPGVLRGRGGSACSSRKQQRCSLT